MVCLYLTVLCTLIKHALSTNQSACYIETLSIKIIKKRKENSSLKELRHGDFQGFFGENCLKLELINFVVHEMLIKNKEEDIK